ncbi:hypothetical protein MUK42_02943 [Musa troglodytarum]|uniref:Nucleotide-diphospho-sugar transferase domain-containing protein n=1 Tax=Musa troglodytarum TaxID=320322 RepID=A0A9E7K3V9_9LILI|nr:hypothetical protein MUK42_02943 [Musa troglodytarum]
MQSSRNDNDQGTKKSNSQPNFCGSLRRSVHKPSSICPPPVFGSSNASDLDGKKPKEARNISAADLYRSEWSSPISSYLDTAMSFSGAISYRATAFIVVAPLLVLVVIYACLWPPGVPTAFFRLHRGANTTEITPKDELEAALEGVAMENRTLVIAILNKAYVEQNAMLDLFLQSLGGGEDTEFLIDHVLFVAVDQRAFNRCRTLELHCYNLVTEGVVFSREVFYMSDAFNNMMWRRTLFLGDVLRRGYSFIFTDMDVMWLRNPFSQLYRDGEDLQMSSDFFYGNPFDNSNFNTGFYFVTANNKTVALFDEWYARRNNSKGMKDQDVLQKMKKEVHAAGAESEPQANSSKLGKKTEDTETEKPNVLYRMLGHPFRPFTSVRPIGFRSLRILKREAKLLYIHCSLRQSLIGSS